LHFGRKNKFKKKVSNYNIQEVGGKIQQIGIFLSKAFLAFWATYSEKILHLLQKIKLHKW
jgi:hypothetical protein